ncbi:MAG: hypothetical protein OEQ53_12780 [Saprospiraceae bacterium]|nr:hypothetical protein [Saprospiraceae bacterium]
MKNLRIIGSTLAACCLVLMACNQEQDFIEKVEADVSQSTELAYIESMTADVDETVDESLLAPPPPDNPSTTDCPVRTLENDPGVFPNTVTLDFGEACEGPGGRVRSGKIIIVVTDSLHKVGANRTVSFDNFFIEGVQIMGSKTWENLGIVDDKITIHKTASLDFAFPDETVSSWNLDHTIVKSIEFIRYQDGGKWKTRIKRFKGMLSVSGSSSGVNRKGNTYEAVIIDPLVKPHNCFWFAAGVVEITINDETRSIDYGDGLCNNVAMVTLPDGTTREIHVKPFWVPKRK